MMTTDRYTSPSWCFHNILAEFQQREQKSRRWHPIKSAKTRRACSCHRHHHDYGCHHDCVHAHGCVHDDHRGHHEMNDGRRNDHVSDHAHDDHRVHGVRARHGCDRGHDAGGNHGCDSRDQAGDNHDRDHAHRRDHVRDRDRMMSVAMMKMVTKMFAQSASKIRVDVVHRHSNSFLISVKTRTK